MTDWLSQADPHQIFREWLSEATEALGKEHATTMCLATATKDAVPSARMVLLKGHDERGFVFYTNVTSQKGGQLTENPNAALCFYWQALGKQVRVEGAIELTSDEEADAYFNSRHPRSRRGAWASNQSAELESMEALEKNLEQVELLYPDDNAIPRPGYWKGFRVLPNRIEFWKEGDNRLHTRLAFTHTDEGWSKKQLNP